MLSKIHVFADPGKSGVIPAIALFSITYKEESIPVVWIDTMRVSGKFRITRLPYTKPFPLEIIAEQLKEAGYYKGTHPDSSIEGSLKEMLADVVEQHVEDTFNVDNHIADVVEMYRPKLVKTYLRSGLGRNRSLTDEHHYRSLDWDHIELVCARRSGGHY